MQVGRGGRGHEANEREKVKKKLLVQDELRLVRSIEAVQAVYATDALLDADRSKSHRTEVYVQAPQRRKQAKKEKGLMERNVRERQERDKRGLRFREIQKAGSIRRPKKRRQEEK